ncbi:MAG: hypothetical protein K0R87_1839 [Pseudonocardia sp.]|nr:hypothetical protein [Pseudonocardia sp.]
MADFDRIMCAGHLDPVPLVDLVDDAAGYLTVWAGAGRVACHPIHSTGDVQEWADVLLPSTGQVVRGAVLRATDYGDEVEPGDRVRLVLHVASGSMHAFADVIAEDGPGLVTGRAAVRSDRAAAPPAVEDQDDPAAVEDQDVFEVVLDPDDPAAYMMLRDWLDDNVHRITTYLRHERIASRFRIATDDRTLRASLVRDAPEMRVRVVEPAADKEVSS